MSKFLCAVYLVSLLSGVDSTHESTVEPITGVRNLTAESHRGYNDSLKGYEKEDESLKEGSSRLVVISNEADEENAAEAVSRVYSADEINVNGVHDINDVYGLLKSIDDLKVNICDREYLLSRVSKVENKEIIYNPNDLRQKSNLSKEQIHGLLEGSNLQVLADSYYDMENKYNINALFLMSLNIEESGHGTSELAQENNNIGGVKSSTGGWAVFDDWNHSLEYIASLIDEMYLSEDGAYYNGTSIYDVNIRYCEGNQWAYNLNTIAGELLEKAKADNGLYI